MSLLHVYRYFFLSVLLFCVFTDFYSLSWLSVLFLTVFIFWAFCFFIHLIFWPEHTFTVKSGRLLAFSSHKTHSKQSHQAAAHDLKRIQERISPLKWTQTVITIALLSSFLLLPTLLSDWLHSHNKNLTCQPMPVSADATQEVGCKSSAVIGCRPHTLPTRAALVQRRDCSVFVCMFACVCAMRMPVWPTHDLTWTWQMRVLCIVMSLKSWIADYLMRNFAI